MLGRYEFKDEKSNKFWQLEERGEQIVASWGRIGSTPQFSVLGSYAEGAKKANEKLRKGYKLVDVPKTSTFGKGYIVAEKKISTEKSGFMAALEKIDSDKMEHVVSKTAKKVETKIEAPKYLPEDYESHFMVHPSRCTADLPEDLSKFYLVAEPKMDGSRYVFYIQCNPYKENADALLSRRPSVHDSKYVDKMLNAPHLLDGTQDLKGTVLDGEIQSKDFLSTNSIMNSTPRNAIAKQNEIGEVDYYAFDILFYMGESVRNRPLEERRKLLAYVIEQIDNPHVKLIEQYTPAEKDFTEYFNQITSEGGEGLIIKDTRVSYGSKWAKMKKSYDVSCVISGFKKGEGKYKAAIGSIAISVYHEGKLTEVGFASGFNDSIRGDMAKNPDKYLGKVVDIFAQEIQDSKKSKTTVGRLRHPTFHRLRDDMNAADCTSEKMWNDFKKVKSERAKKFSR